MVLCGPGIFKATIKFKIMEDIQNATPLEVAAKNHSNTYHNLDHANVAVFSFSAGSIWQKEQDKDKIYTYADMQFAFEAGKNYGDTNARFWSTDGVSRAEYDRIEDFELWIKSYKP